MPRRDDARAYRLRAEHCLEIAQDLSGPRKLVLLEMAQAWLRLADQAKRNGETDLVYETVDHPRNASPLLIGLPRRRSDS